MARRPTSGELPLRGSVSGKVRRYERGNIYWLAATNSTVPVPPTAILDVYERFDFENGLLGVPLKYHALIPAKNADGNVIPRPVPRRRPGLQERCYPAPLRPRRLRPVRQIGERYAREQWHEGSLGFAISDEYEQDGIIRQDFEHGALLCDRNGTVKLDRGDYLYIPPGSLTPTHRRSFTVSVPTHTPTLVFGREPAAWTAAIMSAVALVVAFGINVSTETQGIIQAFVNAVLSLIVVITVRETVLPAIVGVIGTGLPLLVAFGFDLTDQQQGAILAAAPLVLGLLVTRPQVTPTVNATIHRDQRQPFITNTLRDERVQRADLGLPPPRHAAPDSADD